ncbi:MAG: NAD(P)-dependent oxidoreductase [Deltaproteobacteria bacterium]|jgi:nucleoside-diphosphate-sugar epimerase|nr:NAD(P)-dependent oxidoreductase [Deltaproteobacteria bacterium]
MKILVTGNKGYIGSVLAPMLIKKGYDVLGYDIGYFENCLLHPFEENYTHIRKDIRDIEKEDVEGVYAVIHLAGLSNDPLGELAPGLTEEINFQGTLKLAEYAKCAGVKRFIYSSSQSMYGISKKGSELDEDNSEKNALTAYAKTKWKAECALMKIQSSNFKVVAFRPSTVFGASPRLRCDIVYNNLVACAYTTGLIEIKSDGTPWRPVVHVEDVCSAFIAGLEAPSELVAGRAFNVGIPNGNFTVRDLALAAQRSVPRSDLRFTREHGSDSRTYQVGFKRILTELKPYYKPKWGLDKGGSELVKLFRQVSLTEHQFRGTTCNRLAQLKYLQKNNHIDNQMRRIE